MGYFRELPNLLYQSPYSNRISSKTYITAKNIFRRMKIRDDLKNVFSVFNKYDISDGDRPDTVARDIYGKSNLDWVVLITANIINVRDQWPLSSKELYDFTVSKYGLTEINKIKHYKTREIKNSRGVIVQPAGKIVDEKKQDGITKVEVINFTEGSGNFIPGETVTGSISNQTAIVKLWDNTIPQLKISDNTGKLQESETLTGSSSGAAWTIKNSISGNILNMVDYYVDYYDDGKKRVSGNAARVGVSNYEYESLENEKKRSIDILRPTYLQQFLNDIRNEMTYKRSSQFVNDKLIKTENTRITN